MTDNIIKSLKSLFQETDVVFWYDDQGASDVDLNSLDIGEVNKLRIEHNEFEIKYRVTKKKKDEKFLIYSDQPHPADKDNWLLDMELAYQLFYTDKEALLLRELGLDFFLKDLISKHMPFFASKERIHLFKDLLGENDTEFELKYKMLTVTFGADVPNLNRFMIHYGSAFINGNDKMEKDLERFGLKDFFWEEVEKHLGYVAEHPSIYDFMMEAFSFSAAFSKKSKIKKEANFVLSLWKDTVSHRESYEKISTRIAKDLKVEELMNRLEFTDLIKEDYFELGDKKIIHGMIDRVLRNDISNDKLQGLIKERENKFWYHTYHSFYSCIANAADLQDKIIHYQYSFKNVEDGVNQYATTYYEIDTLYRKFIYWYRQTSQNSILNELAQGIEKLYVNSWLLPFNNEWQKIVATQKHWPTGEKYSQRKFFENYVKPFMDKEQRVFVVISDALRYECARELSELLLKQDRYEATITPLLASLPSYTQLGMASLLPHKKLAINTGADTVLLDGKNTVGLNARKTILEEALGKRATAINAEDFMQMKAITEGREFVKKYDVIYIYHNTIDKTGDDKTSEDRLVEAVEQEYDFLLDLLKKIANTNGYSMIITSDHGFLYQYQPVAESDFMSPEVSGEITKYNRRFILGNHLKEDGSLSAYTQKDLGLESEGNVLIPKSINRLRVKGAGSKFVHGGASLQEVVVPVVQVSKKRATTVEQVDIDIIKSTDRITTNILPISFIQDKAVSGNLISRSIKAFIMAEDGKVLSDVFSYIFDSEEPNTRQREVKHRFQLTAQASGKYKNQRVKLVLEEPIENSVRWTTYKEFYYTLNISFASDFDDF